MTIIGFIKGNTTSLDPTPQTQSPEALEDDELRGVPILDLLF